MSAYQKREFVERVRDPWRPVYASGEDAKVGDVVRRVPDDSMLPLRDPELVVAEITFDSVHGYRAVTRNSEGSNHWGLLLRSCILARRARK